MTTQPIERVDRLLIDLQRSQGWMEAAIAKLARKPEGSRYRQMLEARLQSVFAEWIVKEQSLRIYGFTGCIWKRYGRDCPADSVRPCDVCNGPPQ